jgi:hypothetical protein
MLKLNIYLEDNTFYTLPIMNQIHPSLEYIDYNGNVNDDGKALIHKMFFFDSPIKSAILVITDYKKLFELFGHKTMFRSSVGIKTSSNFISLDECSRIFNHNHIHFGNFLTPEGKELLNIDNYDSAWLYFYDLQQVYKLYYDYYFYKEYEIKEEKYTTKRILEVIFNFDDSTKRQRCYSS